MVNQTTISFQSLLNLINDLPRKNEALAFIQPFVFPGGQPGGLAGIDAAIEALGAAGFFDPEPTAVTPSVSVDTTQLQTGGALEVIDLFTPGPATPIAMGVDIFQQQFENLLASREDRRATIDQQVSIAQFLAEAERVSPTRAASINAFLGLGRNIDFGFADAFLGGGQLQAGQGGVTRGTVGGRDVALPNTLSLNQLSFLEANPMIARFIADLGDFLGKPDIFGTSIAGAVPASRGLAALAA